MVSAASWQAWRPEFGSSRSQNFFFVGIKSLEHYIASRFELNLNLNEWNNLIIKIKIMNMLVCWRMQDENETVQPCNWKAASVMATPTTSSSQRQSHHLFFSMRHFGCALGEELEIYFSLYDAHLSRNFRYIFIIHPSALSVMQLDANHSTSTVKSF